MAAASQSHTPQNNGKHTSAGGISTYFQSKIEEYETLITTRTQNLRRLEAQRNTLNARGEHSYMVYCHCHATSHTLEPVRLLREELQLLQEPGSYVGEVVKVMGKKKVLVKVQPEGKYGQSSLTGWAGLASLCLTIADASGHTSLHARGGPCTYTHSR